MPEILADYHWNTHHHHQYQQQPASTMQQATDHFSTTSSTSAAGSPATASLIQQAQPSAAQSATTPTSAGSADGAAAGTDSNGHDYKTVRHWSIASAWAELARVCCVNYVQPTMQSSLHKNMLHLRGQLPRKLSFIDYLLLYRISRERLSRPFCPTYVHLRLHGWTFKLGKGSFIKVRRSSSGFDWKTHNLHDALTTTK